MVRDYRDNQCRKNRELDQEGLERRFTLLLLCLSLFPYKLNRKSLNGVPTRLSHRSFFRRLDLLNAYRLSSDCQIAPNNARMITIKRIKPSPPLG